jgi:hypothetical protein
MKNMESFRAQRTEAVPLITSFVNLSLLYSHMQQSLLHCGMPTGWHPKVEIIMSSLIRMTALATVLVTGAVAIAQPLWAGASKTVGEGQAITTELGGDAKAVTYWTIHPEGALVVTTVDTVAGADTDAEQHAVVRLQATLQAGQAQEISVPLAIGQAQPVLRIERVGDQVSVTTVSQ